MVTRAPGVCVPRRTPSGRANPWKCRSFGDGPPAYDCPRSTLGGHHGRLSCCTGAAPFSGRASDQGTCVARNRTSASTNSTSNVGVTNARRVRRRSWRRDPRSRAGPRWRVGTRLPTAVFRRCRRSGGIDAIEHCQLVEVGRLLVLVRGLCWRIGLPAYAICSRMPAQSGTATSCARCTRAADEVVVANAFGYESLASRLKVSTRAS